MSLQIKLKASNNLNHSLTGTNVETAQDGACFCLNEDSTVCCYTSKGTPERDPEIAGSAIWNEQCPLKYEQHVCLKSTPSYTFAVAIDQGSSRNEKCVAVLSKPSSTIRDNSFATAYHRAVMDEDKHTGAVYTEYVKHPEQMSNITLPNTEHSGNVSNQSEPQGDVNSYQRYVCSDKDNLDGGCYKIETSGALDNAIYISDCKTGILLKQTLNNVLKDPCSCAATANRSTYTTNTSAQIESLSI